MCYTRYLKFAIYIYIRFIDFQKKFHLLWIYVIIITKMFSDPVMMAFRDISMLHAYAIETILMDFNCINIT